MSVWSNQLNKPGPAVLLLTTLLRNKTWKKGRIKSLNIKLQETEAALRRFRQPPNAIKIMALKGVWDVTGLKGAKSTRCRSEVPLNVLKFADFRREKMTEQFFPPWQLSTWSHIRRELVLQMSTIQQSAREVLLDRGFSNIWLCWCYVPLSRSLWLRQYKETAERQNKSNIKQLRRRKAHLFAVTPRV